jgi:hypothetical protein
VEEIIGEEIITTTTVTARVTSKYGTAREFRATVIIEEGMRA